MKDLSECRILIVDDIKANVDVLVQALRNDYKLSVALDGASALRSVEKNPPDLVLLDIVMPGIDGYEVCRRLRSSPATAATKILVVTARAREAERVRGLEEGADAYVTKPFSTRDLIATFARFLGRTPA